MDDRLNRHDLTDKEWERLVPLLPQYPLPEWSINLIYPPHRYPSAIVRTYLEFCQSYLPKIVQACEINATI